MNELLELAKEKGIVLIGDYKIEYKGKKIMQYTKNGELVKEWESIKEATEKLHLYGIGRACRGKFKSSGGYIWKYKEVK